MDSKRAQEIMDSSDSIEVKFKGHPVWIESVQGDHVTVKSIDTNRRFEIMTFELVEGKPF